MKFAQFKIKNFKGIEDMTFDLDKSPNANIYTLVGLNESGKTSILEAINLFNFGENGLGALEIPGATIKDNNILIPVSKRDNFNEVISLEVVLKVDEHDFEKLNEYISNDTPFRALKHVDNVRYYRNYIFKDSRYIKNDNRWSGFYGILKEDNEEKYTQITSVSYPKVNSGLFAICKGLIPSILYFPNFLFDFPSKILLETTSDPTSKEEFYIDLVQDILFSLENDSNIKLHIIERKKSGNANDHRNLNSLLQKMSKKVTDVIFEAWNRIFKREIKDTRVSITCNLNSQNLAFLEFEIEGQDGIYQINERSLGFRWFFTFLLFTQFRPFRKDTPKNIIYLFDEPASNLHSSAQKQLLKSFESLTENNKIIYTTHSHHMINPNWLESTYVVKNKGLLLDDHEKYNIKKTNITIESYREFVVNHPYNTAYFQPILDVLDYAPSNIESIPDCVFIEGKNDYYTLNYFQEIIFKNEYKIYLSPSTGSGNLDTLVSLYIGWGRGFIVLLDSDKEGLKQKNRYIEKYGLVVESKVFTLEDINPEWVKCKLEDLFSSDEALQFQKISYPNSNSINKTHFNRAMQECLIGRKSFHFCDETVNNFSLILSFFRSKLNRS
jgi:energy-coupling factor transporter ATP-binding protein EcfA2